jgi:hypothetical protein
MDRDSARPGRQIADCNDVVRSNIHGARRRRWMMVDGSTARRHLDAAKRAYLGAQRSDDRDARPFVVQAQHHRRQWLRADDPNHAAHCRICGGDATSYRPSATSAGGGQREHRQRRNDDPAHLVLMIQS